MSLISSLNISNVKRDIEAGSFSIIIILLIQCSQSDVHNIFNKIIFKTTEKNGCNTMRPGLRLFKMNVAVVINAQNNKKPRPKIPYDAKAPQAIRPTHLITHSIAKCNVYLKFKTCIDANIYLKFFLQYPHTYQMFYLVYNEIASIT